MFNKKSSVVTELEEQIAALKEEVERYKKEADRNYRMLESVNNSTHLSVWMTYFDESGNPTGARFTDEMRRVLGYSKDQLKDTMDGIMVKIVCPEPLHRALSGNTKAVKI